MRLLLLLFVLIGSATAQSDRASYSSSPRTQNVPVGSPLWQLDVQRREPDTSSPNPDIVSGDGRVFYLQSGQVKAVDAETGKQVWAFRVGKWSTLGQGEGHLFVFATKDKVLYALEAETGKVLWRRPSEQSLTYFRVRGATLFTIADYDRLVAYDVVSGKERWRADPPGTSREIFFARGVVILPSTTSDAMISTSMYAYDRATGKPLWQANAHWKLLAVDETKVYLVEQPSIDIDAPPGRIAVNTFDLHTGQLLQERSYDINDGPGGTPTPGCFYGTLEILVYKGFLYVEVRKNSGTGNGIGIVRFPFNKPDNVAQCRFIDPSLRYKWLAGPYDSKFFLSRDNGFWIGAVPKRAEDVYVRPRRSNYQVGRSPVSHLDIVRNGLYVGHTNGRFYAVDIRTGKALFYVQTDAESFGPARVLGDTLVIQAGNKLLAFALPEELKP